MSHASTSSYVPFYGSSFVPASLGNSIACFPSATFGVGDAADTGSGEKGKKKSNQSKKGGPSKEEASAVKFVQYDALPKGRRAFITETYTVFASLQTLANSGKDLDDHDGPEARGLTLRGRDGIPSTERIAYYSRFAQLYQDCLTRYAQDLSAQSTIDTSELSLLQTLRDIFHLASIIYIPEDGRGDGIVAEEVVDWINATSPWPSNERGDILTGMSAPYENGDFWGFIYSCILRGHFALASSILKTLLNHPSQVLQRLTQSCLDLLTSLPRSSSSSYSYESSFLTAMRSWRNRLLSLLGRLDSEMDDFLDEIMADDDDDDGQDEERCQDERFDWQAGFKALLNLLNGDITSIIDAAEDGWKSALSAWCLLVRPALKRDDLPDVIQSITTRLPPDSTLFKESLSIALLSGDIPKVLRLSNDVDTWFVCHLCDMFSKLGLLLDSAPALLANTNDDDNMQSGENNSRNEISLRDWFVLSYTDLLQSDPGLWRCTVDYLASLENGDIAKGRMRELLLDMGATASTLVDEEDEGIAREGQEKQDEQNDGTSARKEALNTKAKTTSVQDVLTVCVNYGLEDVARSICLTAAESLIHARKYGEAVAYAVRANDVKRINRVVDLILDEYVENGDKALTLIDSIPTSLLHPSASQRPSFLSSTEPFSPSYLPEDEEESSGDHHLVTLLQSTRLPFLARYRDFHALYASGDRYGAADLLVLLMTSHVAPKKFWALMLVDSITLLNDPQAAVSEANTLELMRCLQEIVLPVEKAQKDIYGHLACLSRVEAGASTEQAAQAEAAKKSQVDAGDRQKVQAGLKQLEVVKYALALNLSRCFMRQ